MILSFDHVQVLIPSGRLDEALAFYIDVLGFTRVPKPTDMSQSGAWMTGGNVNLHWGEDGVPFSASGHAHPALRVDNVQELMLASRQNGLKARMDNGPSGFYRGSVWKSY